MLGLPSQNCSHVTAVACIGRLSYSQCCHPILQEVPLPGSWANCLVELNCKCATLNSPTPSSSTAQNLAAPVQPAELKNHTAGFP